MPISIETALASAARELPSSHESVRLDAEVLLAHVLGKERSYLRAWPERELDTAQEKRYQELVRRRGAGEPVSHLTGEREFWSLNLEVSTATLIPRPDTERLVELALERLDRNAVLRVADLGTGCGAVALALAGERPHCPITATDRCAQALAVARRNARRTGLNNVRFVLGDWCVPLAGERFHMIVSNPPYIRFGDPHLRTGDVRFEPRGALVSGADGLDDMRQIAAQARAHLEPGGWLLLEHGHDQGEAVCTILRNAGYADVADYRDAVGHDRVCAGRTP